MTDPAQLKSNLKSKGLIHAFTCRHTIDLISRSLDEKLPSGQRILLHLHLILCTFCRRYRRQLLTLKEALPQLDPLATLPPHQILPPAAKDRIRSALQQEQDL